VSCSLTLIELGSVVQFIACRVCDSVISCVLFSGQGQTEGLRHFGRGVVTRGGRGLGRVAIGLIIILRDGLIVITRDARICSVACKGQHLYN
jgi:hypothetical protein